jgi:hypothetical protein
MVKGQGHSPFAKVGVGAPSVRLGPEHNPWFWNPARGSVKTAPPSFRSKLAQDHPTIEVTWNPIEERWQVFDRCARVNHPICQGWRLLFIHRDVDGGYLPLDERLFARLYHASADAHGSAQKYFERVASEMIRDREKEEQKSLDDSIQHAMESFNHSQISVAMRGKSSGSKFSTYHA